MVTGMTHPLHRYFREETAVTKAAFCERAGISRMTLWRLMNGQGEFSTTLLKQVSEASDGAVSYAELLAALPTDQTARAS